MVSTDSNLNILIKNETTKDGKSTVKGDGFSDRKRAGPQGQHHGGQAAESDDGDTGKQGSTHVQVSIVLGCRTDVRQ